MSRQHYSHWQTPLARDFAWLLNHQLDLRPPIQEFGPLRFTDFQAVLADDLLAAALSACPVASEFDKQFCKYNRLGIYFENLVEVWLRAVADSPSTVRRNLQIKAVDAKTTAGELDFLFNANGLCHHLEVAVKFYAECEYRGRREWLGENVSDSLARKSAHLERHQLPLSQSLSEVTGGRFFWLKGRLFQAAAALRHAATGTHISNVWCYPDQLAGLTEHWPDDFVSLPYQRWLGGLWLQEAQAQARPLTYWESSLEGLQRSVMLSAVESGLADARRIWVMPRHWPNDDYRRGERPGGAGNSASVT